MVKAPGRLLVVATPIGNLADLSPRAREALAGATVVAAEDTRHTGLLLHAAGVGTPLVSLHAHNETQRVPELLERLARGDDVALVSDAGTPLLSDPGFELVSRAAEAGFAVHSIPGPSAITAALSIAGLPTHRFCFEGFLPARAAGRRTASTRRSRISPENSARSAAQSWRASSPRRTRRSTAARSASCARAPRRRSISRAASSRSSSRAPRPRRA